MADDDLERRIRALTDAEKEALRLYLLTSDVKGVARSIGRSPAAAEQRLGRARRKLGVHRTLDAALMLARAEEQPTYGSTIYTPSLSPLADPQPVKPGSIETGSPAPLFFAFPTRDRPWNALPVPHRLVWSLLGLAVLMVCVVLMADVMETATRIDRLTQ